MTRIHVRAREPRDIEALTEILNCPRVFGGTLQLPYRSVESRRERMADEPNADHLVAEIDMRVVGSLGLHTEGTARRFALRGGVYVDAYAMARLLGLDQIISR